MVQSMTGFGRGTAEAGAVRATVEIRSVNNRFADISIRGPRDIGPFEPEMQNRLKQAFERGKFNLSVQLETTEADVPLAINEPLARGYARLLGQLGETTGLSGDAGQVRLEHLLQFSDIFTSKESADNEEDVGQAVLAALDAAIDKLRAMRLQEGETLRDDLAMRLNMIEEEAAAVEARAPERVAEARERLRTRIADVLDADRVDPDRIEQEIVFLADKLDITEEIVRLRSHVAQFRDALAAGSAAVGRKLNFLVQELGREVNTVGSKANDPDIAHRAVRMKEELERIREQVQNVE